MEDPPTRWLWYECPVVNTTPPLVIKLSLSPRQSASRTTVASVP